MNPHIKIIILNWNGGNYIESCIKSTLSIDYNNFSVVIIDNGSTDDSLDIITKFLPKVELFQLERNYGFSGGYNRFFHMFDNHTTDYFILLNNDTEVCPNLINSFNSAREKFGNHNIYGAKIFYKHNPNKIWYAGGKVNLKFSLIYHVGIRKLDSIQFSKYHQTDYVTGCCLFTSVDTMKKLNGFNEKYKIYGEDVDLCLRAKKYNFKCYFYPDAKVWHKVSSSFGGEFSFKKLYRKEIGILTLILNHLNIFFIPLALFCNIVLFLNELLFKLVLQNLSNLKK